MPVLSKSNNKK